MADLCPGACVDFFGEGEVVPAELCVDDVNLGVGASRKLLVKD